MFSTAHGITLEQYLIINKIEKVKELLLFDDLRIIDIAERMNYSSAAHLSKQFKKVTGFTAKNFKELKRIQFNDENPND